ncbi:MAG: type sorting protein [Sphingobacteriales bacterium]|nr:type sorting protein [Sphingobacteriales bacterium]
MHNRRNKFRLLVKLIVFINILAVDSGLFVLNCSAQGLINNGANIVLTSTSNIYIDGTTGNYKAQADNNGNQGIFKNSGGTCNIYLKGNWTNDNTAPTATGFSDPGSTVYFLGSTAQTVGGSNTSAFDNIDCSGAGLKTFTNTATVATLIKINTGTKVHSNNGSLTLLSLPTKNANLLGYGADINNTAASRYITGDVSVQSYFTGDAIVYRRSRFASSPINDSVTTYLNKRTFAQLQMQMFITGSGTGFDGGSTANTIQFYDETKHPSIYSYYGIPTINEATSPGKGYTLFYRGDRTPTAGKLASPFNAIPESKAYVYQGTVNQGDITVGNLTYNDHSYTYPSPSFLQTDGLNLVGNPYPSTINLMDMTNIVLVDANRTFYITNPDNYGFSGIAMGVPFNAASSAIIQPGQGFLIQATANNASITFKEGSKYTALQPMRLLSMPANSNFSKNHTATNNTNGTLSNYPLPKLLRINLQDASNTDETLIVFNKNNKATYKVTEDASYLNGSTVTLNSLSEEGAALLYNGMPDISELLEIKLNVNASVAGNVKLNFTDLSAVGNYQIFLKDNYLNKLVDVKANRSYAFDINKSLAPSFGYNRFVLVFKLPIPIQVIDFTAKVNGGVELNWLTTHEENNDYFELEHSLDGVTFTKLEKINGAQSSGNSTYKYLDKDPDNGVNYYRLKQVDLQGKVTYADTVSLTYTLNNLENAKAGDIVVYPNPATNIINVDIPNRGVKVIKLDIIDLQGRKVKSKTLSSSDKLQDAVDDLTTGIYIIEVIDATSNELIGREKFIKH